MWSSCDIKNNLLIILRYPVSFGLHLVLWPLQSCRFLSAKCWNFDLMRLLQKLLIPTYFAVTIKYCADP